MKRIKRLVNIQYKKRKEWVGFPEKQVNTFVTSVAIPKLKGFTIDSFKVKQYYKRGKNKGKALAVFNYKTKRR